MTYGLHNEIVNKAPVPLGRIFFPIVYDIDKFSNRENNLKPIGMMTKHHGALGDYLFEYLRICFRLYEDSSRPF